MQCMGALVLGPSAQLCVQLRHSQLTARVSFTGWLFLEFPVDTGLAQGSPLCPLLFVIGAQPLAAHLRRQAHLVVFRPISRPDGSPSLPFHQHADDTTMHVRTPQDLHAAIMSTVLTFAGRQGHPSNICKSVAMLLGETAQVSRGWTLRQA